MRMTTFFTPSFYRAHPARAPAARYQTRVTV
jgi:hypothetical protein